MSTAIVFFTVVILVAMSALAIKSEMGVLLVLGICIGVPVGTTLGMYVAIEVFNKLVNRQTYYLEGFVARWVQQRVIYSTSDPMLRVCIRRLTKRAVLEGECGICGSDHEGLHTDPYSVKHHEPSCPVPFARHLYDCTIPTKKAPRKRSVRRILNLPLARRKLLPQGRNG